MKLEESSRAALERRARICGLSRRKFLHLLSAGGVTSVLNGCSVVAGIDENCDCIVIGSGPIGTAAAIQMAEAGLSVLILEGGKAVTDPAGSHLRNLAKFQKDPDSFFSGIGPYMNAVKGSEKSALPGLADSAVQGGQGILWTNNCPRTSKFERWDALDEAEWDSFYTSAERALQVMPNPCEHSRTGNLVRKRLKDTLPAGREVKDLPFSGRFLEGGDIHFIAPDDLLTATKSEVLDRIQIRSKVKVHRLISKDGRITGLEIEQGNQQRSQIKASRVLLAGGAIASPQLLKRSGFELPTLGESVSFHELFFGQVVLKNELCVGPSQTDIAPRLWIPPTESHHWHIQVLRDTFPAPTTEVVKNPHRLLEFQAFYPVEFQDNNRLNFQEDGSVEVQFELSDRDREQKKVIEAEIQQIAGFVGPWRGGGEPSWFPPGAVHLVGTHRMDHADRPGVADSLGKVHGLDNLYLAGVGLIPRQVAVNPTLTALALALNTANQIAKT